MKKNIFFLFWRKKIQPYYNDLSSNESALKARFNLAHGIAMGRERTRHICALKGQHIVENKYIALSVKNL